MSIRSACPDNTQIEVPIDVWSEPFWTAASRDEFLVPRCSDCGTFRWPPGPFCPSCRSQALDWVDPGQARIYSFTIVEEQGEEGARSIIVPALIEFDGAAGVKFISTIVEASIDDIKIGASVSVGWQSARNTRFPVFHISSPYRTWKGTQ